MTPAELAKTLGRSTRWVHRHQHDLKFLELRDQVGHDRYSEILVQQWRASQPVVNFGAGRLINRRAS